MPTTKLCVSISNRSRKRIAQIRYGLFLTTCFSKTASFYVFDDEEPYIIAYRTNRKYFDLDKYLADYFCDNPRIDEIFVSLKKGVAISLCDRRGMDLVINVPVFCDIMKKKYAEFLIMKDKASLKRDE